VLSKAFTTPNLNFAGQGFTGAVPPDTVGDAGPNHYIQMVNNSEGSIYTVYDKSGSNVAGPSLLQDLGSGSGNCATGSGDPIVLYDRLADRWLMSEFADIGNHLCVYISQTPDPVTGGWFLYDFTTPDFPDYPKYGVWPDAYYVSSNESAPAAYALDRANMLTGSAATSQRFTATQLAGFPFQALIPSDHDGASAPPSGAPNYFMRHRDDEVHNAGSNDPSKDFLEIWAFHVDWTTPANSTFTKIADIEVSEFESDLCGLVSFNCFPQPGTTQTLDPLREVIMWRLQYINFGSHETLVGNLVTDVDGTDHGGIRWFELRKTGSGAWTLNQEGTFAPDAASRWMGSIAMDKDGNIALGYSVSSTSVFPSIKYTGRLASDTSGTMTQGENTIINGTVSQTNAERWGDYSAMSVDPADDCTFWYTNEYVGSGGNWQTQIASFKFDSCGSSGAVTANFSGTPTSGVAPLTVAFTDLSTTTSGTITSWSWNFGDSGTSTEQNPSHQYTAEGTYTVSLTVSDGTNSDTETKINYITVEEAVQEPGFTLKKGSLTTLNEDSEIKVKETLSIMITEAQDLETAANELLAGSVFRVAVETNGETIYEEEIDGDKFIEKGSNLVYKVDKTNYTLIPLKGKIKISDKGFGLFDKTQNPDNPITVIVEVGAYRYKISPDSWIIKQTTKVVKAKVSNITK
jgi:PKD repeat protein